MKKLLLAIVLLTSCFTLPAQDVIYYAEDFDGGPNGWTVNTYLCEGTTGDLIGTYELTSATYNGPSISDLSATLSIYTDLEYTLKFEHGPHSGYSQGQFFLQRGAFISSLTGADFDLSGTIDSLEDNGRILFTSQLDITQELFDQWGQTLTGAGSPDFNKTGNNITITSADRLTVLNFTKVSDCGQAWIWHPDGQVGYGDLSFPGLGIVSETAGNGVMSLNADWLSTLGSVNNLPADGSLPSYESELISPVIDLSDATGPVYLRFFEMLIYWVDGSPNAPANDLGFDITTSISYSTDGGQTWMDSIDVNEDIKYFEPAGTNFLNPFLPFETRLLEIPGIAGQSNVRIKFNWTGKLWYWVIDDLSLRSQPEHNLSFGEFVFYSPESYQQPESQINLDTMGFLAAISNQGTKAMTNVQMRALVYDPELNLVHEDSLAIDVLPAGYEDSLFVLPNLYVPEITNVEDEYTIIYVVTADSSDVHFSDNVDIKSFRAHPNRFAKDDGDFDVGIPIGNDYQMGCYYELDPLAGEGWVVDSAFYTVALNAALPPGTLITTQLYEVSNPNLRPDLLDFNFASTGSGDQGDDLEVIGAAFQPIPQNESFFDMQVPIRKLDEDTIRLKPGGRYFLANLYQGAQGRNVVHLIDRDIPYFQRAMVFYDGAARRWFFGINSANNVPVMQMSIYFGGDPNTATEDLLPEAALNIYPNPTVEQISVEVDLENRGPGLVSIINAEGRVMLWQRYESLQKETLQYNVTSYPPGNYFLRLGTEEGERTLPFVVSGK